MIIYNRTGDRAMTTQTRARAVSCALQLVGLLLVAVPLHAVAAREDAITLAGIFREGWASTHLASASIAVHRINADSSILPGVACSLYVP